MAAGLGAQQRVKFPLVRLGQAMKAQGEGSLAAGAAGAASTTGAKPTFHPMRILQGLSSKNVLNPKQLNAAARALTVLETRPEIRGYHQIAGQLNQEKQREAAGLTKLAGRTEDAVGGVYKNIAESEAANLARQQSLGSSLSQQSASIAQQGTQALAGMQQGALGDYESQLQMRGAPGAGGAQQALANAVASQQAQQSTDSQASQQLANQTGADYSNYGRALADSTQMQGGAAIGAIGQGAVNRIGESNAKYNTNIQTARGKLGEAKASFGSKYVKNALGLREGEQKFLLGEQATRTNKQKLAAEIAQNSASNAINQQKANAESQSAGASALNAATDAFKAHHPAATSSEIKKARQYGMEVKALIPQANAAIAAGEKGNFETWNAYINSKASAPSYIVRRVLKNWWGKQHGGPGPTR